jgi:AAA15 family ATPase/GTPase
MLIEFRIKNFRSIKDEQVFSLVGSSDKTLEEENTFPAGANTDLKLVRTAVIYGANASGKSSVLDALRHMRYFVRRELDPDETFDFEPFIFSEDTQSLTTEFEVSFIQNNIRYQYGLVLDKNQILEEWLLAYPSARPQQWFHRKYIDENKKYEWKFSKHCKGQNQAIKDRTRNNVLFLCKAVKDNHETLKPIYDWFTKDLVFIDSARGPDFERSKQYIQNSSAASSENKEKFLKLLNYADPSIADIRLEKMSPEELAKIQFPKKMPEKMKTEIKMQLQDRENIKFKHPNNIFLDHDDESQGTQKLTALAGYWFDAIEQGLTLFVDELDCSLHHLLTRRLVELFCNPEINKKNAQLIFTTHDTSLLDNELLRRDQIWFAEKDAFHATQLYSLLAFSPRKSEAIEKGYLQGRYGALPFIGEWNF